jgi:hypothetical protein
MPARQPGRHSHAPGGGLATTGRASRPRAARERIPAGIQALMDAMVLAPAVVQNGRLDILGANALGRALYAEVFDRQPRRPNLARFVFPDSPASDFYPEWDMMADYTVAILRVEAGHSPYSKDLTDLVGELATRSDEFKTRWAAHHVRAYHRGVKHIHHPVVGDLELRYEAFEMTVGAGRSHRAAAQVAGPVLSISARSRRSDALAAGRLPVRRFRRGRRGRGRSRPAIRRCPTPD